MSYAIRLPDGTLVENIPDEVTPQQARQRILQQFPDLLPKPETTLLGNVGEAFKGVAPGAIGLLESAAVGASALLPDEYEPAVRENIKSVAASAKAPFAAAPGYEDSIGRKFGEALGSTAPFFALGPLGAAGRAGAAALGVGAGAGEARVRAEQEGADEAQRATATGLGGVVGATELLPVFKFIDNLSTPVKDGLFALIRRAAATGGAEAAQEAAAQFAQNAIAKGIYKPDQALIEGLGEEAAYGGAVGAFIQVATDMALGRRAKGAGKTGELPIDKARREAAEKEAATAAAKPQKFEYLDDAGLSELLAAEGPSGVHKYIAELSKQPKSKQGKIAYDRAIKALVAPTQGLLTDISSHKAAEAKRGESAFAEAEPDIFGNFAPRPGAPVEEDAPTVRTVTPEVVKGIGFSKSANPNSIYAKLLGKDLDNAGDVAYIRDALEGYKNRKTASTATVEKIDAFLGTLPDIDTTTVSPQGELDLVPPPRVRTKGERVGQQPTATDTGTTESTVGSSSPTPSIPSVGVVDESVGGRTTVAPDTTGVGVLEPAPIVDDAGQSAEPATVDAQQEADALYTQIKELETQQQALLTKTGRPPAAKSKARAKWDELGAQIEALKPQFVAADRAVEAADRAVEAAPEPAVAPEPQDAGFAGIAERMAVATAQMEATRIEDTIAQLKQEKTDLDKARKALKTKGGAILPERQATYDQTTTQIGNLDAEIKALQSQLAKARKTAGLKTPTRGRPTAEARTPLSALPDNAPPLKKQMQEVIEAVGAYNNPSSDDTRRRLSTDFVFDLADGRITDYHPTAVSFAKRALRHAIDPADLTGPQKRKYDELTKDVKDDETAWGSYRYQPETHLLNTSRQTQQDIELELITKRKAVDVADWVAASAPVPEMRLVASKVADRMRAMENAGFVFQFSVLDNIINPEGKPVIGQVRSGVKNGKETIDISLRSTRHTRYSGMNYETILHELLHAVLGTAIHSDKNTVLKQRLEELLDTIKKDKRAAEIDRVSNAFKNVDELISWGLTNEDVQRVLESIPYKKQTAWTRFVDILRSYLGLAAKQNTALSELLSASEQLLDADVGNDTVITGDLVENATHDQLIDSPEDPSFFRAMRRELGSREIVGLRVKTVDMLAGATDRLTRGFGGNVRDAQGNINGAVLMSRALNADRFSNSVQKEGKLKKVNGLWQADTLTVPANDPRFPDIAGEEVSYAKALQEIGAAAQGRGVSWDAEALRIGELLVGKRYHELHLAQAQGRNSFDLSAISPVDAAQAAADLAADPIARRVEQMLDAVRFSGIDAMQQAGRISAEKADAWKEATGYVPLNRFENDEDKIFSSRGINRGLAALKDLKPFRGDDGKVVNPILQFSKLTDWMVSETMKNDASLTSLGQLELLGYAQRVPNPNAAPNKNLVVTVRENGDMAHYYVPDPADFVAFSWVPPQVSNFVRIMQQFSKVLRAGVTSTPPFVVKQIADDILRVYAYSELKHPVRAVGNILLGFPKAWFDEAFRRNKGAVRAFEKMGIVGSFDFTETGNLKNILEEAGAKKRGLGANILHFMEAGAKAQDFIVRKAIYDQTMKETNDPVFAESQAREIINFSRRGSARQIDWMIRTIPFFNAYARGMDKIFTAATGGMGGQVTGQARAQFLKRMTILTAMGFSYALMMQDDDEYNRLDDNVRDRNWIIPFNDGSGYRYRIPIPEELAFIFKAIPERVVQYYRLQGTSEERTAMQLLGELAKRGFDMAATPNLTPQALRWIYENLANYSFFLGRPLESHMQIANYRPFERTGMETSELSKRIAEGLEQTDIELFKVSPIKLDNMLRSLFGTVAGVSLAVTDALLNPSRTDRPLHKQLAAQATGASSLMTDPIGSRYITMLYDLDRKATQVNGTYNLKLKKDPEDAAKFLEDNYGLYSIRAYTKPLIDQVKELDSIARTYDRDPSIPPEEKREFMDELKHQQQQIARQVLALEAQARAIDAEMALQ